MYNLTSTVAGGMVGGGLFAGGAAFGAGSVLPVTGVETVAMTTGGLLLVVGGLLLERWARVSAYRAELIEQPVG